MRTLLQTRRVPLGALVLALAALAPSCGGTESSAAPAAAKPAAEAPLLPANAEPVPTPDEAAAKAAKEIDEQNADAELEKLKQEIGGG